MGHKNPHHLYFYNNFNKNTTDTESDLPEIEFNPITTLSKALVDSWQRTWVALYPTTHNEPSIKLPQVRHSVTLTATVEERFVNTLIPRHGEPDYAPLTSVLKYKRRMFYFPMDFGELKDGLKDTGSRSSAVQEADIRKIRLLAPQSTIKEGPAPNFLIMVANGQLKTQKSTVELKVEVRDVNFNEIFMFIEKHTGPLIGLPFLQRNNTILDMRQAVLNFPFFSMELKTADHKYTNIMEPFCAREDITTPLTTDT